MKSKPLEVQDEVTE